jgi:hypothetical protein
MTVPFGNRGVAAHAIALRGTREVLRVIEPQVVLGLDELGCGLARCMAAVARPRVMRLGVTGDAHLVRWNVERARRALDPYVTAHACDAGEHVLAMRKCRWFAGGEPEHVRARRERYRDD